MIKTVKIIKENIHRLMLMNGMTSAYALAKACGIDTKTANNLVSKEHSNPNVNPTIKILESYAKPFAVHPWQLLINNFPYGGAHPKKIDKLIQISTELNDEDLQDLLVIAESKYETHKIRQELARYDASNPLLKKSK